MSVWEISSLAEQGKTCSWRPSLYHIPCGMFSRHRRSMSVLHVPTGIAVSHEKGRRSECSGVEPSSNSHPLVMTRRYSNGAVLQPKEVHMSKDVSLTSRWRASRERLRRFCRWLKQLLVKREVLRLLVAILRLIVWILRLLQKFV